MNFFNRDFITMTKRSIIIFTLFLVTLSVASSFKKCCPQGEVFSGSSKINCTPVPAYATELYVLGPGNENFTQSDQYVLPICEDPQDITTIPLSEIEPNDFLVKSSCVEILYDQNSRKSIPIYVYCNSNKDRDGRYSTAASRPKLFNVRRCCTNNTIFNVTTGDCEPTFDTFDKHDWLWKERFLSLLPDGAEEPDFLNVYRGFPKCQAIFTYEVDTDRITFANGSLQASLPGWNETANVVLTERNACFEMTPGHRSETRIVVRVCRDPKLCSEHGCIKKCCEIGNVGRHSEDRDDMIFDPCEIAHSSLNFYEEASKLTKRPWDATEYGLVFGLKCSNGKYYMSPDEIQEITPEGYIQAYNELGTVPHDHYCMDVFYFEAKSLNSLLAFRCFEGVQEEVDSDDHKYVISSILQGISCFFILLTLVVYACLPLLQNLHGKTLMCHCASLFMAYLCLCTVPWITPDIVLDAESEYSTPATKLCASLGFAMLFFFLSAFCWLNVMCFDIWRTFGSLHGSISRSQNHNKRFLLYCLYAWGLSMSITVLAITIDKMDYLPISIRPNFGTQSCWFVHWRSNYSELIFFRGPVAIQLTLNVIFFILTAEKCSKVKAEISRVVDPQDPRSKRFHSARIRFIMNTKLFVVMGISWIAELLPSFLEQYSNFYRKEIFYAADVLNSLQGLLIFILFVMKRRVYQALKKRLGLESRKSNSSQATSMLQDPFRMRKSASNSTLTSSVAISGAP